MRKWKSGKIARLLIFVVRSLETAGKDIVRKATLFHSFTLDNCWVGDLKATNYEVDNEATLEFLKRYKY